jgi:hypothetical protein
MKPEYLPESEDEEKAFSGFGLIHNVMNGCLKGVQSETLFSNQSPPVSFIDIGFFNPR